MTSNRFHDSLAVFRESDPSIIYGVLNTLWAAGRLWNSAIRLPPGVPLFEPRLIAAEVDPLQLVTGVSILPQDG